MSSMSITTSSTLLPSPTPSTHISDASAYTSDSHESSWEKAHYLSLTLWDIEREFQKSYEAYEQWRSKTQRKQKRRSKWVVMSSFRTRKLEDKLAKVLRLGRAVRALLDKGIDEFGARFEQGDSTCNAILSSQLLRVQHEIRVPIEDCALARFSIPLPRDQLLTAAKGVRRTCLLALRDLYSRLQHPPTTTPFLPPPRFSVNFCPFARELQQQQQQDPKKSGGANDFPSRKVRRRGARYDEREACPHCAAHIAVTMHTGLPNYRRLLFQSHLLPSPPIPGPHGSRKSERQRNRQQATFACTSCYKTFEDSYGFLDHVFQRDIGSERSCLKRWSGSSSSTTTTPWQWQWQHWNQFVFESDDRALVDKCLRNCLKREATRAKGLKLANAKILEG
ncbi:uncharacterized protein EI97DRAFT_196787 [Westerdykella ornata]|uniref:Uncharacterized protein n=1 Tax=Westerdykella ornata TaxID=318751 RepID=A0A6A6J8R2_WESOR|nr:uncharacterized protein EI97DRAFT_196787 [Westerdykella ornata]KAF2272812.1 hypothetical protein EI97DRAFT_196787 [Westerdykella ornata]